MTEVVRAGGVAASFEADVPAAVTAMFAALDERFGRLDALVNNAGVGGRVDSITAIDDATWRRALAVNLDGAFYSLRAAIPRMQAVGGGRIVNISSGAARTGGSVGAHYAASKAGLLALTAKAARERLRATIPIGRFGRPQEVAAVVRFLRTEAPNYLTGESISMRGGRL
jgi:NAD(P)-dependent dehydrogenase (short-subunit alcohol dehydrogenase family)